eukprot:6244808-Prymnesium_polylepis.1
MARQHRGGAGGQRAAGARAGAASGSSRSRPTQVAHVRQPTRHRREPLGDRLVVRGGDAHAWEQLARRESAAERSKVAQRARLAGRGRADHVEALRPHAHAT